MLRTGTRAAAAVVVTFGAVMALAGVARAAGRDKVKLKNGRTQAGTVTRDNADGVELRTPSGSVEYSRGEVIEVDYEGTPNNYRLGTMQFRNGNYESAIKFLELALETKHPPLLKQYILYYVAKCYQKLGEPEKAVPAFEGIKDQGKKTRFLVDAVGNLIELYGDVGRIPDSRKMLNGLPPPGTRTEKLNRLMLQATIEEKDKKLRKAKQLYTQIRREAGPSHPEAAAGASVAIARCMFRMKQYEEVAKVVRKLVGSGKLGELYADVYVILGDALYETAKTDEDHEKAILAYLRVPALYAGGEATEARALFGAARSYQRMKGNDDAKARAAKLYGMLRHKYPNSSYAEKAPR